MPAEDDSIAPEEAAFLRACVQVSASLVALCADLPTIGRRVSSNSAPTCHALPFQKFSFMKNLIWVVSEEYEDVYRNRVPYVAKVVPPPRLRPSCSAFSSLCNSDNL